MRISLIENKTIQNIILPNEIEGSYWIDDTDSSGIKRNLISIEAYNGSWRVVSNKEVFYVENGIAKDFVILKDYSFYTFKNSVENNDILIYCSPVNCGYDCYDITENLNTGIVIGNNHQAHICYASLNIQEAIIKNENGQVYIYVNKSNFGTYINNVKIMDKRELKIGDVIFILGLKLVYIKVKYGTTYKYCLLINGNIGASVNSLTKVDVLNNTFTEYEENEEETEYPLYDEKEFFHKTPRFINHLKPLELKVDAPPAKVEEQETSLLLTIGPMLTMSMMSLMMGYTALSNVLDGNSSWAKAAPSLVICVAMFSSVFIWPMITKKYEKKKREEREKLRQDKYGKYIEEKRLAIIEAIKQQSEIIRNNYPDTDYCMETILRRYTTLWQKKIEDDDWLNLNLGNGDRTMEINIKYPEDKFSMVEDNLKDMLSKLGGEPKLLKDVPIVLSLFKDYISGLIGDEQLRSEYMRRLLLQILAFHSHDNLKLVILTDEENEYQWKFLRDCPHCFTDDRSLRFFATNNDEYKEVCYYLDRVFNSRKENIGNIESRYDEIDKVYLIITDSYKKIRDFDIVENILKAKKNYGFSFFIMDNKMTNLPDQCKTFIQLYNGKGKLHTSENFINAIEFNFDLSKEIDYDSYINILANIPIELNSNEEGQLPNKIGFLELYDVGKVEQLNCLSRWKLNNPILNLQVPVGIGKNGEKVSIDLHEKYHGPHGLIAGMTGSGKSEFIITYILSMAINYHPEEVQFILIDYKGGGLAGAFENQNIGLKLPHLVGTITNLDANEIKRSLASIESELKRRQALFNIARENSGESTIDVYKYQKMYRDGVVDKPISHLFIISDEFAELKNQQPEFMDQLISTARIGRSLGVHLILATQKPSGVVDPQIWSNTRFRVCMRVQEKSDSNEVIKCPDAAFLKQTGRFYFQVGYNEVFVLSQAAWAGGKYFPSEKVKKSLDTSINFIDNIGYTVKNIETKIKQDNIKSDGEELLNLVKYLDTVAKQESINCRPLWLEKIPEFIKVEDLAIKYNYQKQNYFMNPIIGEYDIPNKQEQKLLTLPFSEDGNAIVYGASGSGKENFITTLIYSSMLYHTPEEVNYYIIDFGSESLRMFQTSPIIGDILGIDDDKVNNLFKMISATIEKRKELFAEYSGDYNNYCKNSGKAVPNIIVVINNYEAYQETFSKYDDILVGLTRDCSRYGIYFLIAVNTPNGIRFKLKQNFAMVYALQQNNDDDYTTILGNVSKTFPAKIFGRGIIKTDSVYEFQTALATEKDMIPRYIKDFCTEFNNKYQNKAFRIPILPDMVTSEHILNEIETSKELVIGMKKEDLEICKFDFAKNYASIITAVELQPISLLINPLIKQILKKEKNSLVVINAESGDFYIDDDSKEMYHYIDNNFDDIFNNLNDFVTKQNELYIENNYNKKMFENKKPIDCIIIGVDTFVNRLNEENSLKLNDFFTKAKALGIINYILVDSVDKIKKIEMSPWYKNCINNADGIWLGNGISDQFSLKINQKIEAMKEDVPYNFCFVVKRGKPIYTKYVEKFDNW
jgi:type VII secretion protein EssC, C-terminal domain